MEILAHRANLEGPSKSENSLHAVGAALASGFALETDIRWCEGEFYVGHDPTTLSTDNRADCHAKLWRDSKRTVALNVKEPSHEVELVSFLEREEVDARVFLFDMELVETKRGEMARHFRQLHPSIALAARVSDRGEPISEALSIREASIVWMDEFDSCWANQDVIEALKSAGKKVFVVSAELHGHPVAKAVRRARRFAEWGVHGICTDYPLMLRRELPA